MYVTHLGEGQGHGPHGWFSLAGGEVSDK
jgi:hypothetical protein